MRRHLSFGLLVALLTMTAARAQFVSFAPQVVNGFSEPLEESRFFATEFSFLNLSNTTVHVQLELFQDDGNRFIVLRPIPGVPGPGTLHRVEFDLPPRGTQTAETVPFASSSAPVVGWARVESSGEIAWVETLQYRHAPTGAVITSTSLLPEALTKGFTTFVINSEGGARTGIALLNPAEAESAEVEVRLNNRDGSLRDTRTITMEPGRKIAQFFDEGDLFADLGEFSGSAEISSSLPLAVTVIRVDGTYWSSSRAFPEISQ